MPRKRLEIPSYRKRRGRGAVTVYRTDGSGTEIILPGKYGSEESKPNIIQPLPVCAWPRANFLTSRIRTSN
jgi:hypothetical protein